MRLTGKLSMTLVAGASALLLSQGASRAQDKEVVFGLQCDRTGATQTVGPFLCPGYHDYIALINSKGGIEGYKVRVIDTHLGSAAKRLMTSSAAVAFSSRMVMARWSAVSMMRLPKTSARSSMSSCCCWRSWSSGGIGVSPVRTS